MTTSSELKTQLIKKTNLLGKELALLPYEDQVIDELILELEQNNPNELPFLADSLPLLLGKWKLIYAPKVTIITVQFKNFPEVKIENITQTLTSSTKTNQILIENRGVFEFPMLGHCNLSATGTWDYEINTQVGLVKFNDFNFSGSNIFGMSNWKIPPSQIPVSFISPQAKWITSYLDEEIRISKGVTGNIFVFAKDNLAS